MSSTATTTPPTTSGGSGSGAPESSGDRVSGGTGTPSTTLTSRTSISEVTSRLVSEMTIIRNVDNRDPLIKLIHINVAGLLTLFRRMVRPFARAIHRYLGLQDPTNDPNNIIRNTTYTVAADAVAATMAVMYRKAVKRNPGSAQTFGGIPIGDKFQNINIISLLANSIGPLERERDPYRCLFIPYITQAEVQATLTDPWYTPRLAKQFFLTISRSYTQVELTDIDVFNDTSSPWWTLYPVQDGDNRNVYSPYNFNDQDSASVLASISLDDALYALPGPLHTATVGPFVAQNAPANINDIPAALRRDVDINESPPVVLIQPERIREATAAELIAHANRHNDPVMAAVPHQSNRNPHQWMAHSVVPYDAYMDYLEAESAHQQALLGLNDAQRAALDLNNLPAGFPPPALAAGAHAPPRPATPIGRDPNGGIVGYGLYLIEILYFDHIMLMEFPISRREPIYTECAAPNVSRRPTSL